MIDASRLLGGLVGGALPGAASKALRHAGRQSGTSSFLAGAGVPGGALGLIGGLAVAAYEHYSEQQRQGSATPEAPPPPPPGASATPPPPPGAPASTASMPPPPPGRAGMAPPEPPAGTRVADPASSGESTRAMLLIQAMIAAAKADGAVDALESRRILSKLEEAGASNEERTFVMTEMAKPLDVASLVEQAKDPRLALEVYTASLMAIEVDTEAERNYLIDLRARLKIDPGTVISLHQTIGVAAF